MSIPEQIKIVCEPDFRTPTIGRFSGGQFFADVCSDKEWTVPGVQYTFCAVMHIFDTDGSHRTSKIDVGFLDSRDAEARRDDFIAELDSPVFGDIAVKLFEFERHGQRWGLFDWSHAGSDMVELLPQNLSFGPPWDGLYDT